MTGDGTKSSVEAASVKREAIEFDERYFEHPAYQHYAQRLDRLHGIGDTNTWTLEEVKEKQFKDAPAIAAMSEGELLSYYFMLSHRLKAEHIVVVLLDNFDKAIPAEDQATLRMIRRQKGEEEKHEESVFDYHEAAMGMTDREQIVAFGEANSEFVSETLYAGLKRVIGELDQQPTLYNLIRAFTAYQVYSEGVVANWFSKATVDKMKREALDGQQLADEELQLDENGDEIHSFDETLLRKSRFPGFLYGHQKVMQDESRHITFGLEFLRMQFKINPQLTMAAVLDVAFEFKREVDDLLRYAVEKDYGTLTEFAYGKSPEEIHAGICRLAESKLDKIDPQVRSTYLEGLTRAA